LALQRKLAAPDKLHRRLPQDSNPRRSAAGRPHRQRLRSAPAGL